VPATSQLAPQAESVEIDIALPRILVG
jgi:hypothetical protein